MCWFEKRQQQEPACQGAAVTASPFTGWPCLPLPYPAAGKRTRWIIDGEQSAAQMGRIPSPWTAEPWAGLLSVCGRPASPLCLFFPSHLISALDFSLLFHQITEGFINPGSPWFHFRLRREIRFTLQVQADAVRVSLLPVSSGSSPGPTGSQSCSGLVNPALLFEGRRWAQFW